jgi:2-polyprenyl-3-methyl-5-hydroxy-6-metoxy-1,4-benzoquinol methylase
MRDMFSGYRLFNIDAKQLRSKHFYRNVLHYRRYVMRRFKGALRKPSAFRCLLCGGRKKTPFLALGQYELYECLRCGLVSPNIDSTKAGGHELYDSKGHVKDFTREILDTHEYRKETYGSERLRYLLEKTKLKKSALRLLDVGCGTGYFLSHLRDQKVRSKGLELADFLVDICHSQGLPVSATRLDEEPAGTYNAVTLFDVLEHLTDPVTFFKDTNRVLQKGGYVLAYTPHIHSLAYALMGARQNTLYPYQHTAFVDERSLHYLARRTGFEVSSIEYVGLDIMDYFCMKEYDDGVPYLKRLHTFIPLVQAIVDKQGKSNHMRVVLKKVRAVG